MMRMPLFALLALAATGAVADPKTPPAATPIGSAVDCVPIGSIRETHVRDDRTIDFVMNGRQVYRNTLPDSCPELGFEQAFGYETSLSMLCNVDIITVIRHGGGPIRGASCGLGKFQPVTLAPPSR